MEHNSRMKEITGNLKRDMKDLLGESANVVTGFFRRGVCTVRAVADKWRTFTQDISAAVDEERRRLFEKRGVMYEGYFVLTVTWLPPLLAERKAVELLFDDDRKPDSKPRQFSVLLEIIRTRSDLHPLIRCFDGICFIIIPRLRICCQPPAYVKLSI